MKLYKLKRMGCWFMNFEIMETGFVTCCIIFVSAGFFNIAKKKKSISSVDIDDVGNE